MVAGSVASAPAAASRWCHFVNGRRRVSACALPRPSAMASAKLAKSTVNQSQSEMARMNPVERFAVTDERLEKERRREDAADLDDEHDRILELMSWVELLKDSTTARLTMGASKSGRPWLKSGCIDVVAHGPRISPGRSIAASKGKRRGRWKRGRTTRWKTGMSISSEKGGPLKYGLPIPELEFRCRTAGQNQAVPPSEACLACARWRRRARRPNRHPARCDRRRAGLRPCRAGIRGAPRAARAGGRRSSPFRSSPIRRLPRRWGARTAACVGRRVLVEAISAQSEIKTRLNGWKRA